MIEKLLYELAERLMGKGNKEIIDILKNKKDVNEFKIAAKLKLTINQTRNLLYKLYAHDIVSFIRKKDKQRGWYIYYWSLNIKKALELLARNKEKELLQLSYLSKSRENKNFYVCDDCNIELTEETALNHDFVCPECGNLLKLNEDRKKIEQIQKEIDKVKKLLEVIYNEINQIREKEERIRLKKERKKGRRKKLRDSVKAKKKGKGKLRK
jgi:transcription initiation factor TFIIE subunit alpha